MKEISIQWCPTKEMVADFWMKPLQGSLFIKLRDYIMGRVRCVKPRGDAGGTSKTIRNKVVWRKKVKVGIIGCTKVLPQ